jgi:P pilus assembly chaperone PapD
MRNLIVASLLGLLIAVPEAHSAEVSPLLIEASQEDGTIDGAIRVQSTEDDPVAIELTVFERTFDADGNQQLIPADDEFLFVPPQALLQPDAVQVVRFRYLGPVLDNSRNFYVRVAQIPVELQEGQSGVEVVVQFDVSLNIQVSDAQPRYSVVSAQAVNSEDANELRFVVGNAAANYGFLSRSSMEIVSPSGEVTRLSGPEIRSAVGDTLVPARGQRSFSIAMEDPLEEGDWHVAIN